MARTHECLNCDVRYVESESVKLGTLPELVGMYCSPDCVEKDKLTREADQFEPEQEVMESARTISAGGFTFKIAGTR